MPKPLRPADYRDLVGRALAEDGFLGDVTSQAIIPPDASGHGVLIAKQACVLAGLDIARDVFGQVDPSIRCAFSKRDGDSCTAGEEVGQVTGPAISLLAAERTALNFLQYLSGIATLTRAFVEAAGGHVQILDTRKTTPGFRPLAKYAVTCGGGVNHRMNLCDGVLVKDNHIRVAGGIGPAVARVRAAGITLPIEVEAQSLADVDAALAARADIIMLDNLDDAAMRQAVATISGRARIEISGGMTLDRVRAVAGLGADCVSVGALTHSAPAVDLSLEIQIDP